jgi:hypothetical protein
MSNDELIKQLHELADWVEKANHVHCNSVPRRAAYLIQKYEDENNQLRLRLNKRDIYLIDYINRVIGFIRLQWYLFKKKRGKNV